MNTTQISAAKTAELVAFFNANCAAAGKAPVAKFADRKTAERRVTELVAALPQPAAYVRGICPACGATSDITCGQVDESTGKQEIINEHQAMCHSCGHEFDYDTGRKLPKRAAVNAAAGKHIAESWKDPEVFAARVTRHSVKVDGVEHASVRAAFVALGLPLGTHIKFRMALKAAGKLTDGAGRKWAILA